MHVLWLLFMFCAAFVSAENIDPYNIDEQYGWSENTGWFNAEPSTGDGMHVTDSQIFGWIWGENIGWINLSPSTYGGVLNDGAGNLSEFAWGENVGWINFDPDVPGDTANVYKVSINSDGKFSGWAWGENIGWIHFDQTQSWTVRACIVTLEDLTNFASYWLQFGSVSANLDGTGSVDMADYAIFASWWQDYCPEDWPLK